MQWVWTDEDKATLYNMFEQGHWGIGKSYVVPASQHNIAAFDVMGIGINRGRIITRVHNDDKKDSILHGSKGN